MNKFQNKYRISSARLQTWDYRSKGFYFITICTQNRFHHFGEIVNGNAGPEMQLNEIGKLVEREWIKTLELRKDMNLELGEFVVMPNHFHGILIIGENQYNTPLDIRRNGNCRDATHGVSTETTTNGTNDNTNPNKFGPQSKNLASIIRGFKSAVTTQVKKLNSVRDDRHGVSIWQPRFHDHIIRDTESFERIQNYIANNPKNWKEDNFYRG